MKVIFIDFDGVLNSERYVRTCGHYGVIIDPTRMVLLKEIINKTDAHIVLSTSWREHWSKDDALCDDTGRQINKIFADYSLVIYDKTPMLNTDREKEIRAWLNENNKVKSFVVIDDAFLDSAALDGRFVRTSNYKKGLDEESAARAIEILNMI